MFNRAIEDFAGQGAILGCGWSRVENKQAENHAKCKRLHGDRNEFFTIDLWDNVQPDLVWDISARNLPPGLHKRFKLTILEGLPWDAYSQFDQSTAQKFDLVTYGRNEGIGLENILNMTSDDGFILLIGCAPTQEHRYSLYASSLRYVQLSKYVVLVPKDQALLVSDIQHSISSDLFLQKSILAGLKVDSLADVDIGSLDYFNKKFEELDNIRKFIEMSSVGRAQPIVSRKPKKTLAHDSRKPAKTLTHDQIMIGFFVLLGIGLGAASFFLAGMIGSILAISSIAIGLCVVMKKVMDYCQPKSNKENSFAKRNHVAESKEEQSSTSNAFKSLGINENQCSAYAGRVESKVQEPVSLQVDQLSLLPRNEEPPCSLLELPHQNC